ncbi:MAG: hypothetical protein QXU88_02205 [Candidatus Woesearchaeota archaeon]
MNNLSPGAKEEVKSLVQKYKERLEQELGQSPPQIPRRIITREYREFKEEMFPRPLTFYEKLCRFSGKLIRLRLKTERLEKLKEAIETAHLEIRPEEAVAFSTVAPLAVMLFGILISILLGSFFFAMLSTIVGILLFPLLGNLPYTIANTWRMRASNQMVLCIFYVVTYMRHTSNLELALQFASEHLAPPLSLDLKKVLWNVESGIYDTVKESLDVYLEGWKNWNREFVEAFHLIEGSLYEPTEEARLALLDKSLDVILEETYEKMLHYAHNLKSPITTLHMLGIILPVLGLVILPLLVSFIEGVKWYHVAILYNILLPLGVYHLGTNILSTRPTGYGDVDISEINPELKRYKNIILKIGRTELTINPAIVAVVIAGVLFIGAMSPLLIHAFSPEFDMGFGAETETTTCKRLICLLEYRDSIRLVGKKLGPYGLGASVISLLFPLALGLGFGIYFRMRSSNVIKIRERTKRLEEEFASALFQLGNRLGDGIPAEMAVGNVAEVMGETVSGNFFAVISTNIRKLGLGLRDAIFHPRIGALTYFPSAVVESSMKVLVESIKKGPKIAAQALMNVSRYIKEIHRVNERLKDLMADIIADMKSQINFLAPTIAGIVIGITSMITTIIGALSHQFSKLQTPDVGEKLSSIASLLGDGIPTYYFQLVVGIYVVEIIAILTILANGIENGADKLGERYVLGRNLIRSTALYTIVALFVILLFNFIALRIMAATLRFG